MSWAWLRYGAYALFGALFSAIVERVMLPLIDMLGPEADGTMLKAGLEVVANETLLVVLLACAMGVLYRSILQRQQTAVGVRR